MDTLLAQIALWFDRGESVALATVIKTWGSSPRPAGSMMAVSGSGEISGSVSGGCVESAVIDRALGVLKDGVPARLHFGVANEDAWEVGLSCGGEVDIFLREFKLENLERWQIARKQGNQFWIATLIEGEQAYRGVDWCIQEDGNLTRESAQSNLPEGWIRDSVASCESGRSGLIQFGSDPAREIFLQGVYPPRTLVLVGGVHIAIPLASLAEILGFDVIVIDPRRLFSGENRFPAVKSLIPKWPGEAFRELNISESTAVVMLTHDPKIDDPAIKITLASPAFYIGALGSVKTHKKRVARLIDQGVSSEELARIHAPVGLHLGGTSPEEIALAVMAEIVQVWHQKE